MLNADQYVRMHDKLNIQRGKTVLWMIIALIMAVLFLMASLRIYRIEMDNLKETLARIESKKCHAEATQILKEMETEESRREEEEIRIFVEEQLGMDKELLKQLEKAQK